MANIKKDIKATYRNKKGFLFLMLFRFSHFFAVRNIFFKIIGIPVRIFYVLFVQWFMGIDIPDTTSIGSGLNVWHGQGLIVNPLTKIGENVNLCHNTTIGHKSAAEKLCPVIGDNVQIAPHCIIIGNINIGNNSIVGIGTFVNKDVPENSVVYGNPMKIKPINT